MSEDRALAHNITCAGSVPAMMIGEGAARFER